MNQEKELICKKLRETIKEYGAESVDGASIIGDDPFAIMISDVPYIYAPTISEETLSDVKFEVARFFENVL